MLKPGDKAPDVVLKNLEGQTMTLSAYWQQGKNVLLVFLRHLGWLPCREHVAQLRLQYADFQALNTTIVVISFGSKETVQRWLQETETPFPMLLDPERIAYQAYGLDHSLLRSWSPKIWWHYAKLMLSGRRWRGIQGDSGQLGGDFIVDTTGIIRLVHPSKDPADRPSIDQLLITLHKLNLWHLSLIIMTPVTYLWSANDLWCTNSGCYCARWKLKCIYSQLVSVLKQCIIWGHHGFA